MTMRLFLLNPDTVFTARVNQDAFSYPLGQVTYDNVGTGAYGDIEVGMTVLFGSSAGDDDYGRQRIRSAATSDTLYIGRSSQGTHDGEVSLADDAYITVLDDYRVWAKIPYIDDDGNIYKDHNLAVGDRTTNPPPVANAGCGVAGTIDSGTSKLQVALPHETNTSFATDGTISSYLWTLPSGVTLAGGYSDSDSEIVVDCDPGFYWVELTVTDSNSNTHTARVPIFARDPSNDETISAFEITNHRISVKGQEVTVRVYEDITESTYPDGTLAMIWEDEPASSTDRSHMVFVGWLQDEPTEIRSERTGTLQAVELELRDVAGKLDSLPGFSQSVEGADSPSTWTEMASPNMDLYLHYLLHWHSTALEVADFSWSGTTTSFPFVILSSQGESLWDQVDRRAKALVPDYRLVCNTLGQLDVVIDPMLQDTGDRTATVQATLLEDDWSDIDYTHRRAPRVHWLRASAIQAAAAAIEPLFAIAPGKSPGQGEIVQNSDEQLAQSQDDLNSCEGHRYARINAPQSEFTIQLTEGDDKDIEPADLTWVRLTISDAAAQRGLTLSTERGLVKEIDIRYNHEREGLIKDVTLTWERETTADADAVTELPPEEIAPPDWDPPPIPPPPDPGPPTPTGAVQMYILWLSSRMLRTDNLLADSPTWELIDDGGFPSQIKDAHYIHIDSSTIGAWAWCVEGIYRTEDVMADTVTWDQKLSLTTVRANEEGDPHIQAIFPYGADYLIVSTGMGNSATTYEHAYFWYSEDGGENWSHVDMNYYTYENLGYTRCFTMCDPHGLGIDPSDGYIWAARSVPRMGLKGKSAIFTSSDMGATWTQRHTVPWATDASLPTLLRPFPSKTDGSYQVRGGPYYDRRMIRSFDGWETGEDIVPPTGYVSPRRKEPNSYRFGAEDHVYTWWYDGDKWDILESHDGGNTWTLLLNGDEVSSGGSYHTVPNGWPPDKKVHIIVATSWLAGWSETVLYTDDYFETLQDKQGNLTSISEVDSGSGGPVGNQWNGGIALPRVGANA